MPLAPGPGTPPACILSLLMDLDALPLHRSTVPAHQHGRTGLTMRIVKVGCLEFNQSMQVKGKRMYVS
jgi:hypothetical protein